MKSPLWDSVFVFTKAQWPAVSFHLCSGYGQRRNNIVRHCKKQRLQRMPIKSSGCMLLLSQIATWANCLPGVSLKSVNLSPCGPRGHLSLTLCCPDTSYSDLALPCVLTKNGIRLLCHDQSVCSLPLIHSLPAYLNYSFPQLFFSSHQNTWKHSNNFFLLLNISILFANVHLNLILNSMMALHIIFHIGPAISVPISS